MGFLELFRRGPWQIVVAVWLAAAGGTAAWVFTSWTRPSLTANAMVAASFGGMLGFLLSRPAAQRYFARLSDFAPRLVIAVATVSLAGTAAILLPTRLGPITARASACAPLVVMGESKIGSNVSYVLPWLLWLLWCNYILNTFPPVNSLIWDESSSQWDRYGRALSGLGLRTMAAIVVYSGVAVLAHESSKPIRRAKTAADTMAILQNPVSVAMSAADRSQLLSEVEAERQKTESAAFASLANLEFDKARLLVDATTCELLPPGVTANAELVRARSAFEALDRGNLEEQR